MKKVECVIFDWAGTTVDYGCFAPVAAFVKAFEELAITISVKEARSFMGMTKVDHIRELFKLEGVSAQFSLLHKRTWEESDVVAMNQRFENHLFASLQSYTTPIGGVTATVKELRAQGIKIGSTTGYTNAMMEVVAPAAAQKGYVPDCYVTSNGLPAGRPAPFMIYQNMIHLAITSPLSVIKIGDTLSDICEGVNAGVWTVGVVLGSSEMGLTEQETTALPCEELYNRMKTVRQNMLAAGAHYVIDSINELTNLISIINQKLNERMQPIERPYLLLTPGPLTTSNRVKQAMMSDWCTWDKDYNVNIVENIRMRLLALAGVPDTEYTSVLLQGSGTYCVESALSCSLRPSDKLLIVANGTYGERMEIIADYHHLHHHLISLPETEQVTPELIASYLESDPAITHVAVVHCETTTGILNPIEEIAPVVKRAGKTLIVDAMSSFGGIPIDVAGLGIDILISSANKCIQGVPGFGFILLRRTELDRCQGNAKSLSLDLYDQWNVMEKGGGKWRFTSPTHVVRAFAEALQELEEEGGIHARYQRYRQNHRILVDGMRSLGYETLLPDGQQSPIITSFLYPDAKFNFHCFYDALKARGFVIYPGKISKHDTFRIGNIGDVHPADFRRLIEEIQQISR